MKQKRYLVYHIRETLITDKDFEISLRMKLWQYVDENCLEFPEGFKMEWIAFNLAKPNEEFVLLDNHWGKPPHYHIDDKKKQKFFAWISRQKTEKMFLDLVRQRFGDFDFEL